MFCLMWNKKYNTNLVNYSQKVPVPEKCTSCYRLEMHYKHDYDTNLMMMMMILMMMMIMLFKIK